MNETEWAAKISESRERAMRLRDRLAAGEDEATAMRAEGFVGERGINARVEAVRAAYFASKER